MANKAGRIVSSLFKAFADDTRLLPPQYQAADPARQPRLIAHYIAGMTDRYAIKEYRRLFVVDEG
jgi:dGTPase